MLSVKELREKSAELKKTKPPKAIAKESPKIDVQSAMQAEVKSDPVLAKMATESKPVALKKTPKSPNRYCCESKRGDGPHLDGCQQKDSAEKGKMSGVKFRPYAYVSDCNKYAISRTAKFAKVALPWSLLILGKDGTTTVIECGFQTAEMAMKRCEELSKQ